MDKHIVLKKIPGKQRGFNYLIACPVCKTSFQVKGSHFNNGQRVYCSQSCATIRRHQLGDKDPTKQNGYKTGRFVKNGYWFITIGPKQYVYEHRYVMEQHLGRKLQSHEVVHHKDHDRSNNHIDNLELTTKADNSREAAYALPAGRDPVTGRFTGR